MGGKQATDQLIWKNVNNGIIQAFTEGSEVPRVEVDCSAGGLWRFTLDNRKGSGAVMVGPGCHYSPLMLIESMWVGFETGTFNGMKPNARIKFDDGMSENDWSGMFGDDMQ